MNRQAAEAEAGRLLARREELKRLGLELPPDLKQRLKSLLIALGWTTDAMKLNRREQVIRRLARAAGVKRYSEPVQPNQPQGVLAQWKGVTDRKPAKIGTALKAVSDASLAIPVSNDLFPTRPGQPSVRTSGLNRRGVDDEHRVPGGFDLHDRRGRRAFIDYLDRTGEDREFRRRVDDEINYQAYENYDPDLDIETLRNIAINADWTPDTFINTIAEHHPETAEALQEWRRSHEYRPHPQQQNLFDPGSYPDLGDLQDMLVDPHDDGIENDVSGYLRTRHPELDHTGISQTLRWMNRLRSSELEEGINRAEDEARDWYAQNMDTDDIEQSILEDMHEQMDQEGRWDDLPEQEQDYDSDEETPQLTQVPMPQLEAKSDAWTPPERNKWYKKPDGATLLFDLPDGRTFEMDVSEHNLNGVGIHNLTFNDDRGSYGQTGKGRAKSVFDHVAPAIVAYMKAKKPTILTFTAAQTHSEAGQGRSRQKVYEKLVQTLARLDPDYAAGVAQEASGQGTAAYFVFDRNKIDQVEQVVGQRIAAGGRNRIRPLVLSRPKRYAKADSRHQAHPLVEGFPIETFLRHLANDPENHEDIRELAKVALTGGKERDPANVSMALWSLHDAMHEHKHPKAGAYNLMSAGDKVGLDAHTYRALKEHALSNPHGYTEGVDTEAWHNQPEGVAQRVYRLLNLPSNGRVQTLSDIERNQIVDRVKQLVPQASEDDINDSIYRHAHRGYRVWQQRNGLTPDGFENDLNPPRKFGDPKGSMAAMEKATRYRRFLNKLRYALGEGRRSVNPNGEPMFTHEYEGGIAQIVPRNDGDMLHVHYLGPKDASPGQQDQLNTLGAAKTRTILRALKEKYPNSKYLTGLRPNGRRVMKDISKLQRQVKRYEMVAGDFIDALRRIRSDQQKGIRHTVETIAAKIGAKPASTVDALADSPHYSVPGVAQAIYANTAPEAIHALAAWAGLTGNIPGMAVFHYRPDGPDRLHRFRMAGSGQELRMKLDKAGIQNRVLVPHRTGFDVLVPDQQGSLSDAVKNFTKQQKTELQTSRGHFKLIGSSDQAKAREMFRNVITKQEQQPVRMAKKINPWFSHALQVIEEKVPNRATAEQIRKTLINNGVKPDELKWGGIDAFLGWNPFTISDETHGPPNRISKADLLEHVRQSGIKFTERTYGTVKPRPESERDAATVAEQQAEEALAAVSKRLLSTRDQMHLTNRKISDLTVSKEPFSQVRLVGNNGFRNRPATRFDAVRYVPRDVRGRLVWTKDRVLASGTPRELRNRGYEDASYGGIHNQILTANNLQEMEEHEERQEMAKNPESQQELERLKQEQANLLDEHNRILAEQTEAKKAVDAARRKRVGANKPKGKPTRYGPDSEYKNQLTIPGGSNYRETTVHLPEHMVRGYDVGRAQDGGGVGREFKSGHFPGKNILYHVRYNDFTTPDGRKLLHLDEIQSDIAHASGYDHPYKKNWHELALRRMLHHAAANGYDGISWTPGRMQADRYNLGKWVDRLEFHPEHGLRGFKGGQNVFSKTSRDVNEKNLHEFVGRATAQALLAAPQESEASQWRVMKLGEEQHLGGEHHKALYDRMVPQYLSKIGKQHGAGLKMETVPSTEGKTQEVPSMEITPKMRHAITTQGQALYRRKHLFSRLKRIINAGHRR